MKISYLNILFKNSNMYANKGDMKFTCEKSLNPHPYIYCFQIFVEI